MSADGEWIASVPGHQPVRVPRLDAATAHGLSRAMASFRGAGVVATLRAGDLRGALSRWSDLALAALVVSIVGMMIVPLPPIVLDVLIALNIGISLTLLLVSIYVTEALRIATFPTLLLLTTLFRIALQVSATRLILVRGDAGQVITAFGRFVVAGNLVVGVVIFLILTVVQFVVITRGAERVAEVAARFTLDAMPGKQMAIDAELRAGHIDGAEAQRRRGLLARESQLFGSMDGAMKFVKGDAIAGLVVLAVNVVGGLVVGVMQRNMELAAAARTYTLLTIGEGLVSQIPALLISTSAGIIVTRVASDDEGAGSHLGREIAGQILGQPRALAIAAGLLAVLALVPGLPAFPFILLAAPLGFVAVRLLRWPANATVTTVTTAAATAPTPLIAPIIVELGPALGARLCPNGNSDALAGRLSSRLADRLFAELGIPLPAVRVRLPADGLAGDRYRLLLNEVALREGSADPRTTAIAAEEGLGAALEQFLRRYGADLVGIQETQTLLDALTRTHPALVREVVPRLITPAQLADVLRRLLDEGVSLRNLKDILGALAIWTPHERDPVALTEHVRAALRRPITFGHATAGVVGAYRLDPLIEDAVRDAIQRTSAGSTLALEPLLARDILAAVGRALASSPHPGSPVILTSADIRRYVRRLIETDHPNLAVLAYPELAPEARVQDLGAIRPAD
jgi:type III secretion protein V